MLCTCKQRNCAGYILHLTYVSVFLFLSPGNVYFFGGAQILGDPALWRESRDRVLSNEEEETRNIAQSMLETFGMTFKDVEPVLRKLSGEWTKEALDVDLSSPFAFRCLVVDFRSQALPFRMEDCNAELPYLCSKRKICPSIV